MPEIPPERLIVVIWTLAGYMTPAQLSEACNYLDSLPLTQGDSKTAQEARKLVAVLREAT